MAKSRSKKGPEKKAKKQRQRPAFLVCAACDEAHERAECYWDRDGIKCFDCYWNFACKL